MQNPGRMVRRPLHSPSRQFDAQVFQATLLAQLFGETRDLRLERRAARLREDVGEVAHDDKGNKSDTAKGATAMIPNNPLKSSGAT
jgi:hypothetical protein